MLASQVELIVELPGTLAALNRTVRNLADTVNATRDAVTALQRVALRTEAILDDVEPAVRGLLPGMTQVAETLRDPRLTDLVTTVTDAQRRLTSIASTTERLTSLVDDASGRLSTLPGAAMLARGLLRPGDRGLDRGRVTPEE